MNFKSYLSDKAILEFKDKGEIIIEPFNIKNLNTGSYDVTLGENYFREQPPSLCCNNLYNMYSKTDTDRVWGEPLQALSYEYYKSQGIFLENIDAKDKLIIIGPGETILGHTNEFIGGVSHVNTMMKARSSIGRNFIKTCSDA